MRREAPITSSDGPPLQVCPSCGIISVGKGNRCEGCNEKVLHPIVVHDPASGFWVGLDCEFTCSACGNLSPLNYLATEGEVQCLRCGIDIRFDAEPWWRALEIAHETGDLCGPSPEGRFPTAGETVVTPSNDYADVGVSRTFVEYTRGSNDLHVRAAPGHPLCESCKQPLQVAHDGNEIATTCPSCRTKHSYLVTGEVRQKLPALAGVADLEHELGGQAATIRKDASGGMALRCPNCAGELKFDAKSSIVQCPFCQTSVRLPTHRLRSLGDREPARLRWWLFFTDASAGRKKFEAEVRERREAEAKAEENSKAKGEEPSRWETFFFGWLPILVLGAGAIWVLWIYVQLLILIVRGLIQYI